MSILKTEEAELRISVNELAGPEAIIYFGGNAEDVSLNLPEFNRAFSNRALYLLHYRGYGGSSGKPSEHSLHQDALALFDHVRQRHSKITVVGRSLGSGVAIRLAALRPISRLVLITPYNSIEELAARQFPLIPVRWILRDKFESWRYAPEVKAPTTMIVAEHDEIIPAASSLSLYSRFSPGIADYIVIPGSDHNDISNAPEYWVHLAAKKM